VDANGNLSWTNDGGLSNPPTVNIKGSKGDKGDKGDPGVITEAELNEIAEAVKESVLQDVTDTVTQDVTNTVTEVVTNTVTEVVTHTVTETVIETIKETPAEVFPMPTAIQVVEHYTDDANFASIVASYDDGTEHSTVSTFDGNGYVTKMEVNGTDIPVSWVVT
jgi:ABC-type xylose transport system substrate-binding protein